MSKINNFLDYIHNPMSTESIIMIYGSNNVISEKCELYGDFVQSLLSLLLDTYMGDDVTSIEEQMNHFKWGWDKNMYNFRSEGLDFQDERLYDYFLEFMLEVFYTSPEKNHIENLDKILLKLWADIFDYDKPKTNADIDTLVEIYRIFEKALKTT